MGDLPNGENTEIFQKGSYCNGWPMQGEKYKDFSERVSLSEKNIEIFWKKDLIVMSDLPMWKNTWIFFEWPNSYGRPAQVTNLSCEICKTH